MECILRNVHQISLTHSLHFVTDPEVNISINDDEYLIMVCLRMQCIATVTDDADIRRQMPSIKNENPLYRIVFCRLIGCERLNYLIEVLKVHHFSFLL